MTAWVRVETASLRKICLPAVGLDGVGREMQLVGYLALGQLRGRELQDVAFRSLSGPLLSGRALCDGLRKVPPTRRTVAAGRSFRT